MDSTGEGKGRGRRGRREGRGRKGGVEEGGKEGRGELGGRKRGMWRGQGGREGGAVLGVEGEVRVGEETLKAGFGLKGRE